MDEVLNKNILSWPLFLKAKLIDTINKCNNSSTSGLDKLFWSHLKDIVKDEEYVNKLIDIVNTCINLGHWPDHFKISTTIIILKPNKILYDSTKSFHLIILLNITSKLFEKIIGEMLQFLLIFNNFVYPCQLGSLKYYSFTNTRVVLTYII